MSNATLATLTRMLAALPDPVQERVVEHLYVYIEDLRDELHWDAQFSSSQTQLAAAARKARKQIAQRRSKPLDVDRL